MVSVSAHYDNEEVTVRAKMGDYTHRPDGCFLHLTIGLDDFSFHIPSVSVAGRIADVVSAAVRAYMQELDESVVTIPDSERRPLTVISPPS